MIGLFRSADSNAKRGLPVNACGSDYQYIITYHRATLDGPLNMMRQISELNSKINYCNLLYR